MTKLLFIAIGGSIGALARYLLATVVQNNVAGAFPWGTLVVNLIGCFVLGMLMALAEVSPTMRPEVRSFIGVGILGAFTTFSTFGYETSTLLRERQWGLGAGNILASVACGLLAIEAGRLVVRWVVS